MPIIKAAKKDLRQANKRRLENTNFKKTLKKAIKTALQKIKESDGPQKMKEAIILIDKASKKHIIHKNKAAHLKSRLMKKLKELKLSLPAKPKTKPIVKAKAKTKAKPKAKPKTKISVEKKSKKATKKVKTKN